MQRFIIIITVAAAVAVAQTPANSAKPAVTAAKPTAAAPAKPAPKTLQTRPGQAKAGAKKAAPARPSPQEVANQLAEAHEAWGPAISSTIASASLQEVARNGAIYTYHLYAAGLPRERLYNIVAWPVNQLQPLVVIKGVTLDASGRAVCSGRLGTCGSLNTPDDPVKLSSTIAPGRPVRVGIEAQDGSASAYVKTVPTPIRGVDKKCTLEAVMLTPSGTAALIEVSGFTPNSEIDMQLLNGAQRDGGKTRVDEKGTYSATVMPVVEGVSEGTIKVNVMSAQCSPSLSFDWNVKPQASAQGGAAAPGATPAAQPAAAPSASPAKDAAKK